MQDLLLAIGSIISNGWSIFCVNIPILNIPFWSIPATAIAVDLAFWLLGKAFGSGVGNVPEVPPKHKTVRFDIYN